MFVDRLLASWAAWARATSMPTVSRPSLTYSSGRDTHACVLNLPDDDFGKVDSAVAKLTVERRVVVWIHYYCRSEYESKRRKATLCGMSLRAYEALLREAQLDVLATLGVEVEGWQAL